MKKFRLSYFFVVLLLCALAAAVFTACGGESAEDAVASVEITRTADENGTVLSWKPVKGVSFSVYRAPSRYAEYKLVEEGITNGKFSDGERYCYYRVIAKDSQDKTLRTFGEFGEEADLFGENVYVFSPSDSYTSVNKILNEVYTKQFSSEFTSSRYAFYFKPGVYNEKIALKLSYYTTFAGLGVSPDDVTVRSLNALNGANGNALINFWRGTENLTVNGSVTWAVSQGAYLRGVNINGSLSLHDGGKYASGGFLADSRITGTVNSGSQQQWFSRNCSWKSWSGQVWNMCFAGVDGAPQGVYPTDKYTVLESVPQMREKPRLVFTENGYRIAVPAERENAAGCSRNGEITYIDGANIYFAKAESDTAQTVNAALNAGKSIFFTPGIYQLNEPLVAKHDGTVLLGSGLATLTPTEGNVCLRIEGGKDVTVAGLLFDAGEKKSESLFDVGTAEGNAEGAYLFDCFFRVGGANKKGTAAETCLRVYADETVLDNIWLWRADHGSGVGWDTNDGQTGMCVYADNVSAYGLFSEHFKKNNVLWLGNGGNVTFYQSEIAYDVPSQARWMDGERKGYASFQVGDGVETFTARGLGIYSNFHNDGIVLESAMKVPSSAGITVEHICAVALSKKGAINNIVNGAGGTVDATTNTRFLERFENEINN